MQFSGKDIEKQCNRMRLLKGKALYASGKVQAFEVLNEREEVKNWLMEHGYEEECGHLPENGENTKVYVLDGKVQGSEGQLYDTSIVIDDAQEDKVLRASCTCADFVGGTPFCKHCVAVAHNFVVQDLEEKLSDKLVKPEDLESGEKNGPQTLNRTTPKTLSYYGSAEREKKNARPTSNGILNLIDLYSGAEKYRLNEKNKEGGMEVADESVKIVPYLQKNSFGQWVMDFRLGVDKMYVIKDVLTFISEIRNCEFHNYGKQLAFVQERSKFTKESRFYIELMEDLLEFQRKFMRGTTTVRYMHLESRYIERLLEYIPNRKVHYEDDLYRIKDGDPKLALKFVKAGSGCDVSVEDVPYINGIHHAYIVLEQNKTIYRVTQEYRQKAFPIVQEFRECRDSRLTYSKEKKMYNTCFLNKDDYTIFCGHLLRKAEKYFKIDYGFVDVERYMPPECEIKIYLDAAPQNLITCRMKAIYNREEYDITEWNMEMEGKFRDTEKEQQAYTAARKYFTQKEMQGEPPVLCCDTEEDMYLLIQYGIKELEQYGELYVSEDIRKIKVHPAPQVTAGVRVKGSLLELSVSVPDMDEEEIVEILSAYRLKKHYYRMKNGDIMELSGSSMGVLTDMSKGLGITMDDWKGGQVEVPIYRANFIDAMMKDQGRDLTVVRSSEFRSIIRNMKEVADSDYEVPDNVHAKLRGYQKTGYRWLRTLSYYGFGGILADDMGLGKTLQVLTLVQAVMQEEDYDTKEGVALIVCPASLVYNWESECRKFTPDIRTSVVVGTAAERREKLARCKDADLVITSYDLLKRDLEQYEDITFTYMIIDEAQYIKNATTQVSKAVKKIQAKQRFALTGTPVENRLSDLWSIFDFVMPGYLYTYDRFKKLFEQPIVSDRDETALVRLRKLVSPFILRRKKKDVLKDLPEKIENVIYMNMTGEQKRYYNARFMKLRHELAGKSEQEFREKKLEVLAELTRLRQLCCDPSLFVENYRGGSGKVDGFVSIVEELVDNGSNILVFSQFSTMLEILKNTLETKKIHTLMLTGKNTKEERRNMVEEFQQSQACVFLISLKAGGTGLNLTAADTVIHFDPWWNLAAQNQATDRAHRIGQDKVVTVMQLVMKNSIEERIIELQNRKKELVENVIEAENVGSAALSKEEIMELLEEFE